MGFAEFNASQTPIPFRGPVGLALAGAVGEQQDAELALLRTAVLSWSPVRCPADALPMLGHALQIERYAADTDDSYRARLVAAWETWAEAGAATSIETQIRAFGIPDVRVYTQADDRWRAGPGDGEFSHFDVACGPDFGDLYVHPLTCGSWTCGDEHSVCGTTMTRAQIVALKRIILKWKSAHGYPVRLILIYSDAVSRCGVNLICGQWTCGDGYQLAACAVPIGRTLADTITTAPFICGAYEV